MTIVMTMMMLVVVISSRRGGIFAMNFSFFLLLVVFFGSFHLEEASGSGIKELKGLECRQCGKYGRFMGQMVVTDIGPRMLPTD